MYSRNIGGRAETERILCLDKITSDINRVDVVVRVMHRVVNSCAMCYTQSDEQLYVFCTE